MNVLRISAMVLIVFGVADARGSDDLARRSSWASPTQAEVQNEVTTWFSSLTPSQEQNLAFREIWDVSREGSEAERSPQKLLDAVVQSVAIVNTGAKQLVENLTSPARRPPPFDVTALADEDLPDWARNNLRLRYAQWLADRQYYDEVREQIESLSPTDVVDPAALLFYQGVAYHRLLEKEKCLPVLDTLLENENSIPHRYVTLARLMKSDIQPLKIDSLDEVARLMDSIRVRLGHGRAGTRVRKEEDDVIAKLDKMIEQLEQQAQQSSSSSASGQGNNAPSMPMERSVPAQAKGPGNVDPKKLGAQTDWGDLPAKDREEALQELGKDLPSHYRDVIEEYFRKLAKDGVEP